MVMESACVSGVVESVRVFASDSGRDSVHS